MKFHETGLAGVFEIEAEPVADKRGAFARLYCPEEFSRAGISYSLAQINLSRNPAQYTLRGMHWQDPPFAEAKFVRCMTGRIWDVVADIRKDSPTYKKWIAREIDAKKANAIFIPEGYAHGFITLDPDTDVLYQMGRMYEPGHARGFRFDDPLFGIEWPHAPEMIGDADWNWPAFA
ncbi:MAG: dTDP-4-dehydrorhamnose 3,5-epimerase family protein [Beijerinckiaceae bacterium]